MRHSNRRGSRQGRHDGRHGFGPWSWRGSFFERGELPLALLSLLADGPRHGYELMKKLESRTGGLYEASAGSVYPTLQQLHDQDLAAGKSLDTGKRIYELTENGRQALEDQAHAVNRIWARAEDQTLRIVNGL